MSDMQDILNLIRSFVGQANVLTIPRAFVALTGDLKAALFLSQCVYWSSRSSVPGVFYKTYQDWQEELTLSRYEIDQCRRRVARWVKTELRQVNGVPVLHYLVNLEVIAADLVALLSPPQANKEQTYDSQMDLLETSKSICEKLANGFARNSQIASGRIKGNLTEITNRNYLTETSINGFASDADASTRKTNAADADLSVTRDKSPRQKNQPKSPPNLPAEIVQELQALGWRGPLDEIAQAWEEDSERVRQWLWYARRYQKSGAFVRSVLRHGGEYPPEVDPNSDYARQRYLESLRAVMRLYDPNTDDGEVSDEL